MFSLKFLKLNKWTLKLLEIMMLLFSSCQKINKTVLHEDLKHEKLRIYKVFSHASFIKTFHYSLNFVKIVNIFSKEGVKSVQMIMINKKKLNTDRSVTLKW